MVNVLRWLNMFHGNEVFGYPSFKTLQCIWGLESIGHVIACLMSCESFDRLPRFFVEWEMLQVNDSKILNSMKRIKDVCTVGLLLFVCTSFGFTVYLQLFTEVLDITLTPWDKYSKYVVVIQIISLVHQFYVSIARFAPTVLMFIICKALAYRRHWGSQSIIQRRYFKQYRNVWRAKTVPPKSVQPCANSWQHFFNANSYFSVRFHDQCLFVDV